MTHEHPYQVDGNLYQITTLSFAPVNVRWQTYEVAGETFVQNGQTVLDPGCDGYRQIRQDLITAPHRTVASREHYAMPVDCVVPSLDEVFVSGSGRGLSISFASQGYFGYSSLDLGDPSAQEVYWSTGIDGEEVFTSIVASLRTAGTPTTKVTTEQGRTVRTTTRPMTLALNLDLPDGTPTTGTCRVDHVNVHVAAEPTE